MRELNETGNNAVVNDAAKCRALLDQLEQLLGRDRVIADAQRN